MRTTKYQFKLQIHKLLNLKLTASLLDKTFLKTIKSMLLRKLCYQLFKTFKVKTKFKFSLVC